MQRKRTEIKMFLFKDIYVKMASALVRCVSSKVKVSKGLLGLSGSRFYSAPSHEEPDPLKGKIGNFNVFS